MHHAHADANTGNPRLRKHVHACSTSRLTGYPNALFPLSLARSACPAGIGQGKPDVLDPRRLPGEAQVAQRTTDWNCRSSIIPFDPISYRVSLCVVQQGSLHDVRLLGSSLQQNQILIDLPSQSTHIDKVVQTRRRSADGLLSVRSTLAIISESSFRRHCEDERYIPPSECILHVRLHDLWSNY